MRAGGPASCCVLYPTVSMMSSAGRQSPAKISAAEASLCRPIRDSRHDRLLHGFYIHGSDWDMNWVEQLPTPEGVVLVGSAGFAGRTVSTTHPSGVRFVEIS